MGDRVRIVEVSPRDGLQNEPAHVPTTEKARLVRALLTTGVDEVEATSFVSPKWIPQLGDAAELLALLSPLPPASPAISVLVPNERGLDAALLANASSAVISRIAVFTAASETFSQRNTNASIAQTLERFAPVIRRAREAGLGVRGYVSCAFACPFEGPTPPSATARVAAALTDLGAVEVSLGDTIGAGTTETTLRLLEAVRGALGRAFTADAHAINFHLHDTFGRAADCVRAALREGVRSFDASAAGLGGCPYASTPAGRAPGNLDTAVLVRLVREAGHTCGVDEDALTRAAAIAREVVRQGASP